VKATQSAVLKTKNSLATNVTQISAISVEMTGTKVKNAATSWIKNLKNGLQVIVSSSVLIASTGC
jgi:hypothetical protein